MAIKIDICYTCFWAKHSFLYTGNLDETCQIPLTRVFALIPSRQKLQAGKCDQAKIMFYDVALIDCFVGVTALKL